MLAYAVIMLNTDAHNPMVLTKMTKADFVHINTSTDAEEHAPQVCLDHTRAILSSYLTVRSCLQIFRCQISEDVCQLNVTNLWELRPKMFLRNSDRHLLLVIMGSLLVDKWYRSMKYLPS